MAISASRAILFSLPAGVAIGAWATSEDPSFFIYSAGALPLRLARDAGAAASTLVDYKWSLHGLTGDAYEKELHACHERGAQRLLNVCFKNGGIYIKLGQHLGMLDHLIPAEYVQTMRKHMLNRCPVSSWEDVRRTIFEDLGASPDDLFARFTPEPLASASLAQVHEAETVEGRCLAVKVQHRGLRESSSVDLATLGFIIQAVKWLAPDFDYQWLIEEAQRNIPQELDFRQEAANAERCRRNLEGANSTVSGQTVVPAIDSSLSSSRVLTMEFIDGVIVTDRDGLRRLGIAPAAVAERLSRTFNEMIFRHGYVHCDPHAANILVRRRRRDSNNCSSAHTYKGSERKFSLLSTSNTLAKESDWELVLLDHGLYRQLDDALRLDYAGLWLGLVLADEKAIRAHALRMNAGLSVPLFAGILTHRRWSEVTRWQGAPERLRLQSNERERREMSKLAAQYAALATRLLRDMPRPLLLLLKTNDCLRAVDRELGAPVNNFAVTARECCRAVTQHEMESAPGPLTYVHVLKERLAVESRLLLMRLFARAFSLRTRIASWWRRGDGYSQDPNRGLESQDIALPALT